MRFTRALPSLAIALGVLVVPSSTRAQSGDTISTRSLAVGVQYHHVLDPRGPWTMHLVRINLREAGVELRHARALDQLKGREKTTSMVQRATAAGAQVLAAVNADFFELRSGENENNQVVAGEWWKGVKVTESPYDTYDNPHIQLAIDAAGRPQMDRYILDATAWARGVATPIINVNANPSGNPEGSALYTARFGAATPRDTTRQTAEAPLASAGRRGDTLLYVRRGAVSSASGTPIPPDGAVLSAYGAGSRTREVLAMADGDTVRVLLATLPRMARGGVPAMLIGGWPRILKNGRNVTAEAPTVEGTISRNAEARHPRTAIGFSRDSLALFIVTVDGRSEKSVGMTLSELATTMLSLGAWDAMNFDGGGSTTMVIGGVVVNKPSDPAGEREVGNALFVVKRPSP